MRDRGAAATLTRMRSGRRSASNPRSSTLAAAAAIALSSAGCGSTTTDAAPGDGGVDATAETTPAVRDLPCDVDAILEANCRKCHSDPPRFGAPMPLVSHAHLHAKAVSDPSKDVAALVKKRIHDDAAPMPQPPNPRLSAADLATIDAWVDKGAPKADVPCGGTDAGTDGSILPTVKCTPDIDLKPATPWVMPKDSIDQYVCFGIDVKNDTGAKRQLTAILPRPDNAKLVHHMVLVQSTSKVDPTPKPCSAGAISTMRMVYAWAPGGSAFELPKEAGFPVEPGEAHYMVQMHYNNALHLEGEKDSSGFAFCSTSELRPNDADVLAFGSQKFTIPAKSKHEIDCSLTVPKSFGEFTAIGAFPHMHRLGRSISTTVVPAAGGAPIDLGTNAAFDFNAQYWFDIADTKIRAGDTIHTRCAWDNTTASPVGFGENTDDEMCYSFTIYYPKITTPVWSWALPAYTSSCK